MAGILERLTASDQFMLMWDDYGWPNEIGALAILDGTVLLDRDGRVRVEVVQKELESRLHRVPRFRQLLYRPRLGLGWPLWIDDPSFDIANHVRVHPVTGDHAQLLKACEELARRRLDPGRPLWELWLLPGLPDRRVGAFLKVHHVVADGAAGVAAFGVLLGPASDAVPSPWMPKPRPTATELLRDNARRRARELGRAWSGLTRPHRTVREARRAWPAWREVLTEERAPRTSVNRPVGADRRIALVRGQLEESKRAAHRHDAKVNDVVLAATAGGLRDLLLSRGEDVRGLTLRAMVPISLHEDQAHGNKPGWMMVPLPVGEADPERRLELIAAETAARRHKARPEAGTGMFRFLAAQRVWYRLFPRQRSVNVVVTNVPGPPVPVCMAGARLLELFPVVPVMGNLTVVVAALSYAGQLNLAAVSDRDGVDVFAQGVRGVLHDLTQPMLTPKS